MHNGEYYLRPYSVVKTITYTNDGDWKTAIALNIQSIPKGTELIVEEVMQNFYGKWLQCIYNGRVYSIDPMEVDYIKGLNKEKLMWIKEVLTI